MIRFVAGHECDRLRDKQAELLSYVWHLHTVCCMVPMDHPYNCADEKLKSYLLEIPDYRVILLTSQDDCTKGFVCCLVC